MATSILRLVIELVSMLGKADSHGSYGTCLSLAMGSLRTSMAEAKPPDVNAR